MRRGLVLAMFCLVSHASWAATPQPRGLVQSEPLAARQRGFRNDEVLRIAQIPADESRDFVLFMVQQPDDQVFFYFSTVREGLKKAFVSIPGKKLVAPLEPYEAERNFRAELLYWEDKAATR